MIFRLSSGFLKKFKVGAESTALRSYFLKKMEIPNGSCDLRGKRRRTVNVVKFGNVSEIVPTIYADLAVIDKQYLATCLLHHHKTDVVFAFRCIRHKSVIADSVAGKKANVRVEAF